ncbi:MAG: Gfo/Idh/MocA family oxidoreductase [Planctomycetota bacterium]|nr:Gfo/Idh/MocA family oxidoreductase [Planctomycetota bacterium]
MTRTPDRISRRTFLARSAGAAGAAAGAFYVLTGRAAGGTPPSRRITVACIGMGRQAVYSNVRFFLGQDDAQVVAVCDVDRWRLDRAKQQVESHYAGGKRSGAYAGCGAVADFRDILGRDDVDAVMISTPDHWHVPMAIAAARAGKDVCLEKPITLSIAEGRRLVETFRRTGRVFRVDSEFRSIEVFQRACELVRNGRIGRLRTIRAGVPKGDVACPPQPAMPVPDGLDYRLWLGPAPAAPYTRNRVHTPESFARPGWMRCRDYCEGMITNWGAHLCDIAQWGHGTERTGPVRVEGRGTYPTDGLWNVLLDFEVRYRFADGVEMVYETSRPYVRFEGDEGWVEAAYGSRQMKASHPSLLRARPRPGEVHLPRVHEKRDFLDCVRSRRHTIADAEVGHRTNSLCQVGHVAIQVGRTLRWDPQQEVFPDDAEANRLLDRPSRSPWTI